MLSLDGCSLGDAALATALPPVLEWVSLAENGLTAVPAAVPALTDLTGLVLSGNQLMNGGWQQLTGLRQLQLLYVDSCGLTAVPPAFSQLVGLTSLHMHHNPIASGWEHLAPLTALVELRSDPEHSF